MNLFFFSFEKTMKKTKNCGLTLNYENKLKTVKKTMKKKLKTVKKTMKKTMKKTVFEQHKRKVQFSIYTFKKV